MSAVRVIRGGMLTTIQDTGRWGYQSRGVPVAGPMDPVSHRLANALVGNDRGAATLEVTLLGPELEFEDERVVAVTGAEFEIMLDGRPAPIGTPFMVAAESHLRFGQRRRGSRAYLAIRGGVSVPLVLGSRSTHVISAMGGIAGRPVRAGDRIALGVADAARPTAAPPADPLVPLPARPARLRVLPGPQADAFTEEALDTLQSAPYTVGQQSDRMGFRLEGPRLTHARGADIISDAARRAPGAGVRSADPAHGRSSNHRRLPEDCYGDLGRSSRGRPARPRRYDRLLDVYAARSDGGADRSGTCADGPRNRAAVTRSSFVAAMHEVFGADRLRANVRLAPFTTFKVGGAAEWLLETRSSDELVTALRVARAAGVPVTMLGGGSNVLVADRGVRGLVIRPRGGDVALAGDEGVRADAAVTINGLVRWTINHGRAGLEAWAGTPGTVGGAIFGNAHFGGRLIGELVTAVRLVSRDGTAVDVAADRMAFGYDRSRLQDTGEILLSAVFRVWAGEPPALRAIARASLAFRKRTQPLETPSAGCIFQNPEPGRDAVPDGIPWSAGALVDRVGLKGLAIGGAQVSATHGNFIVNNGTATAHDIRRLIDRCRDEVATRFGVKLREEIVYMGEFADTT